LAVVLEKTGPILTDRRNHGSKRYLVVDLQSIPLRVILTGTNRHDLTQLEQLVDASPLIRSKPGQPSEVPKIANCD